MIAWMLYAALVGGIVALGGAAMEKLAAARGRPRRVAWLAALTLAVVIPLTGVWRRPAMVPVVVESGPAESVSVGGAATEDFWSVMPTLPVPQSVSTGKIAVYAWGAGSFASLAVLGGVLLLVARRRRRWERTRVRGSEVYVSRRFGPALVGVARPEVVIPAWVLDLEPGARDAIIRHETEHARARDHLVLLYGALLAAAFPWSPAIWWMYRRLRAAVELDCDQRVLASGIGVADYGDVLLGAGCRSRGRWGFSPAMGQPESLLERRLKTMSETGRKPSAGYVALLVAVAAGALAVACDTPVPTEVREAFEEVMAEGEAQGADAASDGEAQELLLWTWGDVLDLPHPRPLIYVDGVRIRGFDDVPRSLALRFKDGIEPDAIERVEVLKGPAAAKLYGEEGAGGAIQIFTKGGETDAVLVAVPSAGKHVVTEREKTAEPDAELVRLPSARSLVVRPARARQFVMVRQGRATYQASDWDEWFSENVGAKAPPGWKPVVYLDGVRVDGAALSDVLRGLDPDRIDRVEAGRGEVAEELYGSEGASGVIHIHTKKGTSSHEPSSGRSR